MRSWINITALMLVGAGVVAASIGWLWPQAFGLGTASKQAQNAASAPVQVRIQPVRRDTVHDRIEALGTAYADESVDITAPVSERVEKILVQDGQLVQEGDVLALLEQKEEAAQLAAAEARVAEHRRELARLEKLIGNMAVSERAVDERRTQLRIAEQEVKEAQARLQDRTLRAPFPGVAGLRRISEGALVQPGQSLTGIDDIRRMKIDFSVPETVLPRVRPGTPIEARSDAFPGRTFTGEVSTIGARIDPVTRAGQVRALLPNPQGSLLPGMLLHITVLAGERQALTVPEQAIAQQGDSQWLFVLEEAPSGQVATRREIRVGARWPGRAEILSGAKEGEQVVTEGLQTVKDGGAVQLIPQPISESP